MKQQLKKNTVLITNATTGETRLSEPVAVHSSREMLISESPVKQAQEKSYLGSDVGNILFDGQEPYAKPESSKGLPSAVENKKATGSAKPKVNIETLEQFIEYAYSRNGKSLTSKEKLAKQIAQNLPLDEEALTRLLTIAVEDELLAVPSQILLFSREFEGFPRLRTELISFVFNIISNHPIFSDVGVQAVLRNLPEAPSIEVALKRIVAFEPVEKEKKELIKGVDLQTLRRNAVNLLIIWLASDRSLHFDELVRLLFHVVWQPAARELDDDNARLRALTALNESAGVGFACMSFRQQAIDAHFAKDQALREFSDLSARLAETNMLRVQAEEQRDILQSELEKLREISVSEMAALRDQHEIESIHLRHNHQRLRGRMVRSLDDSVEMLEVGLTALRSKTPRVEVMLERAEHVVDALHTEIKYLREE